MILGAMIVSMIAKEFKPRGGSAPMTRFVLAVVVMVGALMFLGCPLRMMIRIGGGDLNAIVGLVGFIAGIFIGTLWLRGGFSLKRAYAQGLTEGIALPVIAAVVMALSVFLPSLFAFSESGPGAAHAPILIALGVGLVVGGLCQRARFCTVAGNRDAMMFKDFSMLWGFLAVIVTVLIGNLILGKFNLSCLPISRSRIRTGSGTSSAWRWSAGAVFCSAAARFGSSSLRAKAIPTRAITITGFAVGAAICHNFGLASSPQGPTVNGMVAVVAGFVILIIVGLFNRERS